MGRPFVWPVGHSLAGNLPGREPTPTATTRSPSRSSKRSSDWGCATPASLRALAAHPSPSPSQTTPRSRTGPTTTSDRRRSLHSASHARPLCRSPSSLHRGPLPPSCIRPSSKPATPAYLCLRITADRPPALRGTGAPQTIDQVKLYGTAPKWFHETEVPESVGDPVRAARALAMKAWTAMFDGVPGPVHINMPFDEPLVPRV